MFVKEFKVPERFGKNLSVERYLVVQDNNGGEYLNVRDLTMNGRPFNPLLLIKFENFWSEVVL